MLYCFMYVIKIIIIKIKINNYTEVLCMSHLKVNINLTLKSATAITSILICTLLDCSYT